MKGFFDFRSRFKKFFSNYLFETVASDIELYFRFKALESTGNYVMANMKGARNFKNGMDVIKYSLEQVTKPGLYCEFGVYVGTTTKFIRDNIKEDIHGFDSFKGLPESWMNRYPKGVFALDKVPDFGNRVKLHVGWFNETLPGFVQEHKNEKLAFLHIDCDLYSSTKTIFDNMGGMIQDGTVILFDEYFNYIGWEEHEYLAFKEFISKSNFDYEYLCYGRTDVALRIKAKK